MKVTADISAATKTSTKDKAIGKRNTNSDNLKQQRTNEQNQQMQ